MRIAKNNKVMASKGSKKFTGNTWDEFINTVESAGWDVDSAFKRNYDQWITVYDKDGKEYDAEVTKYSDGTYELMEYNITKVPVESCDKIQASTADKAVKHIKAAIDVLGKSGNRDDVTKDSIANLATVMFDLKGSTLLK